MNPRDVIDNERYFADVVIEEKEVTVSYTERCDSNRFNIHEHEYWASQGDKKLIRMIDMTTNVNQLIKQL